MNLISPATGTEPHTVRAAAVTLADRATDPGDLRDLLEACGLITMPAAAPRDHEGRTIGRCPSCRRVKRLTLDGLLNAHGGNPRHPGTRCPGGGKAAVRV